MQAEIGQRIRQLRQMHQPPWTMNRLAVMAHLDPGQLSRAERGLAGLSLSAMMRIAGLLGISLAELVDPEHCVQTFQNSSPDALVQCVTENIWASLNEQQLQQCSPAELDLIRHHIRSAIEEGVKRGQIQAEREIEFILSKYN